MHGDVLEVAEHLASGQVPVLGLGDDRVDYPPRDGSTFLESHEMAFPIPGVVSTCRDSEVVPELVELCAYLRVLQHAIDARVALHARSIGTQA